MIESNHKLHICEHKKTYVNDTKPRKIKCHLHGTQNQLEDKGFKL
jgi:hypothetical protein